jgi:cytochrome c-type biogenesis protein CcmE
MPSSKQWRLVVGGAIVVVTIAYLVLSGMRGAAIYALTIPELKARVPSIYGQGVRVGGAIDGESIAWDATTQLLSFTLVDGDERLTVAYQGTRPDMFRDGAQALVEGKLQRSGTFEASKLLLKCPTKYEAAATATATR